MSLQLSPSPLLPLLPVLLTLHHELMGSAFGCVLQQCDLDAAVQPVTTP